MARVIYMITKKALKDMTLEELRAAALGEWDAHVKANPNDGYVQHVTKGKKGIYKG